MPPTGPSPPPPAPPQDPRWRDPRWLLAAGIVLLSFTTIVGLSFRGTVDPGILALVGTIVTPIITFLLRDRPPGPPTP